MLCEMTLSAFRAFSRIVALGHTLKAPRPCRGYNYSGVISNTAHNTSRSKLRIRLFRVSDLEYIINLAKSKDCL